MIMDATTTASAVGILTSMGLPGLIILALALSVYKLYNRNQELQDKRIDEARESLKVMSDITTALGNLSDVIKQRNPQ